MSHQEIIISAMEEMAIGKGLIEQGQQHYDSAIKKLEAIYVPKKKGKVLSDQEVFKLFTPRKKSQSQLKSITNAKRISNT